MRSAGAVMVAAGAILLFWLYGPVLGVANTQGGRGESGFGPAAGAGEGSGGGGGHAW